MSPAEKHAQANIFLQKIEETRQRREIAKKNYLRVHAEFELTNNVFLQAHRELNSAMEGAR